jgi:hypothetical protein
MFCIDKLLDSLDLGIYSFLRGSDLFGPCFLPGVGHGVLSGKKSKSFAPIRDNSDQCRCWLGAKVAVHLDPKGGSSKPNQAALALNLIRKFRSAGRDRLELHDRSLERLQSQR